MTTARWDLPCDTASPSRARQLVRDALAEHPEADELADDAVLLVSEVVANAVRHAQTPARLTARVGAHRVRIEVEDESPRLPVIAPLDADELRETGRGLALVERVAQAWGIERHAGGKVVWFELGAAHGSAGRRSAAYLAG